LVKDIFRLAIFSISLQKGQCFLKILSHMIKRGGAFLKSCGGIFKTALVHLYTVILAILEIIFSLLPLLAPLFCFFLAVYSRSLNTLIIIMSSPLIICPLEIVHSSGIDTEYHFFTSLFLNATLLPSLILLSLTYYQDSTPFSAIHTMCWVAILLGWDISFRRFTRIGTANFYTLTETIVSVLLHALELISVLLGFIRSLCKGKILTTTLSLQLYYSTQEVWQKQTYYCTKQKGTSSIP